MGLKAGYKLLGKLNVRMQPQEFFYIKAGYHHAVSAESFDATGSTDEFQRSVYELAASLAGKFDNTSVLDVGCGSAYKLIHMLGSYDTLGMEVEPAYSWLRRKYPDRKWLFYNSSQIHKLEADIVICADVIEHIQNPDEMMNFLWGINFSYLILSTPERDRLSDKNDYGPPVNTSHYREWNSMEFKTYVSQWFTVEDHHVFNDRSITQVAVCSKKIL